MGIVIIDGREVEISDQERLNGIQAAARAGDRDSPLLLAPGLVGGGKLPHVPGRDRHPRCRRPARSPCSPSWCPACNTPARDGTVIVTQSEKVQQARAMVEEDLLLRHPIDCPICDKAGECQLQDYHFRYGQEQRRADIRPFTSRRRDVGDDDHAVRRPLRDVQPLRPLHPRDQRHGRADGHPAGGPRGDRRRARLPAGTTSSPATWSTCARWGPWATRIFSTGSGSGIMQRHRRRLHGLRHRLLDLDRREPGPRLPDQAPREPACQPVVDLQRRPLRLPPRPRPPAAHRRRGGATPGPPSSRLDRHRRELRRAAGRRAGWPPCSRPT